MKSEQISFVVYYAEIVYKRHMEQTHLSRYTLSLTPYIDETNPPEGDVIQALPGSPGKAEGKAHVIRAETVLDDFPGLEEGDILVLKGEGKVGLTMFFSNITGLIYENGNPFCHEVNLCRELGKPCVVCLGKNIELIGEGDYLRIDGQQGTVMCLGSKIL